MAESNNSIVNVLLGYQDELISEKYLNNINYTTNKIGGRPDWPPTNFEKIKVPKCPLCEIERPLILQIYAPIENSKYHRTLYIFACINPNCWNQNESWTCIRTQLLDTSMKTDTNSCLSTSNSNNVVNFDWCENADDWGDNFNNNDSFNGNLVTCENNIQIGANDDDDDDSYSFEEQMSADLKKLNFDDKNANTGLDSEGVGAVGRQNSPIASAEIENDESELITIDAPVMPQNDLHALLHAVVPLPHELCTNDKTKNECRVQFVSFFINVSEEFGGNFDKNDLHIRDLLQEYQQKNDENLLNIASNIPVDDLGDNVSHEKYEKSYPAHGDKYFHYFLNRIQQNPGQILRYHRGGTPLILYPIQDFPKKCRYCSSEMLFELQILPTLIPKLRLNGIDENFGTRIEFGNILIYTCSNSCWGKETSQQYHEEIIIVQSEK